MANWIMKAKKADFKGLSATLGVDQVIVRLMVNRGLESEEDMRVFLNPDLKHMHSPYLLKDVELACEILMDAIDEGIPMRIIGDYDIDGIMSTYILHQGLLEAGAIVDYAIPHRIEDGYGVNPDMVQRAYDEGIGLIITCDNGIAAADAIKLAKELGMIFIVTDHHQVPYELVEEEKVYKLPPADAVVDPQRVDCQYPFKSICGAQVAWKLIQVLYDMLGMDPEDSKKFLQFAAFAAIGDIMELKDENRDIVYFGLQALEHTDNPGMRALIARCQLIDKALTAYHIGFVLGPCMNASGRLDTAARALELLEETNPDKAIAMADELVTLNEQRKALTVKGVDEALELIENSAIKNDRVLVVYMPSLHESLAGIVAGRIKEAYYRPTIVLTDGEEGVKGSARSIEAYNMFEELNKVADIFTKFGGHPMAAGLSLPTTKVDELRTRLNELCTLSAEDLQEVVRLDMPMPLSYISEKLVDELNLLEPFGNGNSKPVFAIKDAMITRVKYLGKDNQYLKLSLCTETGASMDALCFSSATEFEKYLDEKYGEGTFEAVLFGRTGGVKLDLTYYPSINEFRGTKTIQIIVDKYR